MSFDPDKYKRLVVWISKNTGCKFKVKEDGVFTTYINSKGLKVKMTAPAKDPKELERYLKHYIDTTGDQWDLPGVEFSNDYKQFKIYVKLKPFN